MKGIDSQTAHRIMGKNFFGMEDAIKHFGVQPTAEEKRALSRVPFQASTLENCRCSHILIAVFPLSVTELFRKFRHKIVRMRRLLPNTAGQQQSTEEWPYKVVSINSEWFFKDEFANRTVPTSWHLVKKDGEQEGWYWWFQRLVFGEKDKDESITTAQIMVYTIIGHLLQTNEQLFWSHLVERKGQGLGVRCSDTFAEFFVDINYDDVGSGLCLEYDSDCGRDGEIIKPEKEHLVLAVEKKPDLKGGLN